MAAAISQLNAEQALTLARADDFGMTLSQRIILIEGPSRTGKTGVTAKIILQNVEMERKWLLVAVSSGGNRAAPWPFDPIPHTHVLHTDAGLHYHQDESEAPPLPEVNSDVTITEQYDRFMGTVVSIENRVVTMKVVRNRGVGTLIISGRSGKFVFSNPGAAFVAVKKAVQK